MVCVPVQFLFTLLPNHLFSDFAALSSSQRMLTKGSENLTNSFSIL